jgi:DNA-binding MarR family transcriptional regulator
MKNIDLIYKLVRENLTAKHLLTLILIREEGETVMGAIAAELELSSAAVTGIIDSLEHRGLVMRIRSHEDRRKITLEVTKAGIKFIDSFMEEEAPV